MEASERARIERLESAVARLKYRAGSVDPVQLQVTDVLTYTSPSQVPLYSDLLKAGDAIRDVSVVVSDGFNDFAATISVGTLAAPSLIVATGDVIAQVASEFRVPRTYIAPVNEPLFVFITPGTSTTGAFRVYFAYERA